jgi:voltage-gated potassium channel
MQNMSRNPSNLDRLLAAPMFAAAVLFLAFLAGLLHLSEGFPASHAICQFGMLVLYPAFIAEWLLHRAAGSRHTRQNLVFCLFPPLRLGARDHASGTLVWLPKQGWTEVNRTLQQKLEKGFSLPMICVALLVLPVVAIDPPWVETTAESSVNGFMQPLSAFIWFAFAFEFMVMISIVDRKLQYLKKHWLDVVVILVPLVTFLRIARIGRLARLTRTARIYGVRGPLMRAYRAVLLLNVIGRLLCSTPEKRLAELQHKLAEKEHELEEIRREIQSLQAAAEVASEARRAA